MVLGVIGSIAGGLFQSSAAKKAAAAQERAAERQIEFATETRDMTREDLRPFYHPGVQAQNALASIYGLAGDQGGIGGSGYVPEIEEFERSPAKTGYETKPIEDVQSGWGRDGRFVHVPVDRPAEYGYRVGGETFSSRDDAQGYVNALGQASQYESPVKAPWELTIDDFEASPGYQFRLGRGLEATAASAAGRHGLGSGASMAAANDYAQGMASAEYGNFYNRSVNNFNSLVGGISGLANSGQNAAAGMGAANATAGGQVINALGNQGNAQAAGYIGSANALSDGIGNAVGAWQYQNMLNGGNSGGNSANKWWPF